MHFLPVKVQTDTKTWRVMELEDSKGPRGHRTESGALMQQRWIETEIWLLKYTLARLDNVLLENTMERWQNVVTDIFQNRVKNRSDIGTYLLKKKKVFDYNVLPSFHRSWEENLVQNAKWSKLINCFVYYPCSAPRRIGR